MNAGGRAEGRVCEICAMPWRVLNACKNPFLFKESVGSLWPRTESSSDHTLFFSAPNHLPAKNATQSTESRFQGGKSAEISILK